MNPAVAAALVLLLVALVLAFTFVLHPFYALWLAGFITAIAAGLSPAEARTLRD